MNKEFYIEFNTKEMPGRIKAITVTLDTKILDRDPTKAYPVNLSDHPLYENLVQYVRNNPVRKSR